MDQENQAVDKIELDNAALSALIKKIGEGDSAAFTRLYDGTSSLIFGLLLRILADRTDAEEALLDVYTRIWKESRFYSPKNFMPLEWIITVARTCAITRLDGTREGRKRTLPEAEERSQITTVSPAMQNHARTSLDSLTAPQKEFLDWIFYTGLSCGEIAARTGKPTGAVKTHSRIGMSKLYELFRPLYERETGSETATGGQDIES